MLKYRLSDSIYDLSWCISTTNKYVPNNENRCVRSCRFSADGGSPPSASQRSPRAPSPQRLPTSRLVAHHPRVLEARGHQLNISLGFISISISHSVKRSQKPMNTSTTNDYEDRNSPPFERRVCSLIALSLVQATAL
jgi:hypothetical protein